MHARIFLHASTFTPGPIHSNPLPHCFKFGEKLYFPWQRHIWRKRRPDKEPILKGVHRSNISCQSEVFPGWRQAYISSKCHFSPRTRCSFYLWIANNPSSPTIFSQWFLPVVFQFIWHVEKKNHFNCNRWIWIQLMHLWSWQYIFFLQMTSACQNIHGLVLPGFGAYPSSHIQVCDIHSDPSDNHWGIFNIMKEHSKVIIEKYFIFKTFQIYRFLSSKFQNACRFIESIYKCKNR